MNILKARQLQRLLYRQAKVEFKKMRCSILDGNLFYYNIIKLSGGQGYDIEPNFIKAMGESTTIGHLKTTIQYFENTTYNSGEGMYLIQVIKID